MTKAQAVLDTLGDLVVGDSVRLIGSGSAWRSATENEEGFVTRTFHDGCLVLWLSATVELFYHRNSPSIERID